MGTRAIVARLLSELKGGRAIPVSVRFLLRYENADSPAKLSALVWVSSNKPA
jgi:hypothetical protein